MQAEDRKLNITMWEKLEIEKFALVKAKAETQQKLSIIKETHND